MIDLLIPYLAFLYLGVRIVVRYPKIDRRAGVLAVLGQYNPDEEIAVRRARVILSQVA
jgi:ribosomal protein S16